jgi:hypothetical protein
MNEEELRKSIEEDVPAGLGSAKQPLEKLVTNILRDRTTYEEFALTFPLASSKLSAYGLSGVISTAEMMDKYGMTHEEQNNLQIFLQDYGYEELVLNLYTEFPGTFEGEPREFLKRGYKEEFKGEFFDRLMAKYNIPLW